MIANLWDSFEIRATWPKCVSSREDFHAHTIESYGNAQVKRVQSSLDNCDSDHTCQLSCETESHAFDFHLPLSRPRATILM